MMQMMAAMMMQQPITSGVTYTLGPMTIVVCLSCWCFAEFNPCDRLLVKMDGETVSDLSCYNTYVRYVIVILVRNSPAGTTQTGRIETSRLRIALFEAIRQP